MSVLGFNSALEKQPSEILSIKANFADIVANLAQSGYSLNAVELIVYDSTGANQSGNMVSGTPTIDANNHAVLATFKAGSDGQDYFARFKTTWVKATQPDQTIERDLKIEVRQKGW